MYEEIVPKENNPNITFLDHGTYHSEQDGEENCISMVIMSYEVYLLTKYLICAWLGHDVGAGFCRTAKRPRPKHRPLDDMERLSSENRAVCKT